MIKQWEVKEQIKKELKYEESLTRFLRLLEEREIEYKKKFFPKLNPSKFSVDYGRKYDRIVVYRNQKSAYAFINRETGGIIKPTSWKSPEPKKRERGNIYNENPLEGIGVYGVNYLNG